MKAFFFLLFTVFSIPHFAQNLLANASFEEFNTCKEFEARCAPEAWFRIPPSDLNIGTKVFRSPQSGKISELVVVENVHYPLTHRIYLYTKILCPLTPGNTYQLRFYLNPLKIKNYQIEVLLSEQELISGAINPLNFEPTLIFIEKNEVDKNKKTNWRKLETTFVATGKEVFLTLGNFSKKASEFPEKFWSNKSGDIAYLIDNIALTSIEEASLCENYFKNRKKLYQQDYRHTNKISVDSLVEILEKPPPSLDDFLEKPIEGSPSVSEPKTLEIPYRESEDKKTITFEVPNVAFDFDQSKIKEEFQKTLDQFAQKIESFQPARIEFVGHTDSMGSEEYNQNLSLERAKAVREYLVFFPKIKSIPSKIIGKGESEPKATNDTLEGREQNRRVEIIVYKKEF